MTGEPSRVGEVMQEVETVARCKVCRVEWRLLAWRLPGGTLLGVPDLCESCRGVARESGAMRATQEAERLQSAAARRRKETRLEELAIPALYQDATIDNFARFGSPEQQQRTAAVVGLARRYVADWPDVGDRLLLAFTGSYGSGKTRMGYSLARAVIEQRDGSARVVKLKAMVTHIRGAWNAKKDGEEERRVASYLKPDLLVVDEVTADGFAGDPRQVLYDVVNGRYEDQRPTILTSHETPEGFARLMGDALLDRIAETGGTVHFGNESYRRARGASSQGAAGA